jgi:LacI family transcriptional regulator
VLRVIHELDYRPNRTARLLRSRTAQKIGLVVSDIQNSFFTSLLRGVEDRLQPAGYVLLVGNTDEDPSRQAAYLEVLVDEGVAGIILVPTSDNPAAFQAVSDRSLPLVILDRRVDGVEADSIRTDNITASQMATRYLIDLGHQRIAYISGLETVSTSRDRETGFRQALVEAGLPIVDSLIQPGNYRLPGGYQAMRRLLDQPDPPSAVLVGNNVMALGALQLVYEVGLSIPQQISMVAFDDIPWAVSMQTPLTVIDQRPYEIGQKAAELALARIREPERPFQQVILKSELIIRASCGSLLAQTQPL